MFSSVLKILSQSKRAKVLLFLAVFVFCFLAFLLFFAPSLSYYWPHSISRACYENQCLKVVVAVTAEERQKGLSHQEFLPSDEGLLFVFPKEENHPAVWMKDMRFPLDIIWLNKSLEIIQIEKNVPPCGNNPCPSLSSAQSANYVLEVNAGISDQIKLQIGSRLSFEE